MIKLSELINDTNKYKIYCDLDGVLADFDRKFETMSNGINPDDYVEKYGYPLFWKLIGSEGINFWHTIPQMKDASKLWSVIKRLNPTILTAIPEDGRVATKGKTLWIKKNLGQSIPSIICLRSEKKKYAAKNSILIDDLQQNITEWETAGGIGILHRNANSTISQLKKLRIKYE